MCSSLELFAGKPQNGLSNTKDPLNKSMAPLAFSLFRGRGVSLKACVGLSKRDNEEIGTG